MTIKKLDQSIVEKIAAGEVVERPASVVKELIENAIDAQATIIAINLEEAGQSLIEVIDNGAGMDEQDLAMCTLPHTTSKINSADDLFAIQTLGFRGEALASVCAVSKCTVTTRQQQSVAAHSLKVEGGIRNNIQKVGAPQGTTVNVQDLFFNVPARKKFMKTKATELQTIANIVSAYCLAYPSTQFTLINDKKVIIQSPKVSDLREKIAHIHGTSIAKKMFPLAYDNSGIKISGYTGDPSLTRADKSGLTFFINGRVIKNTQLAQAVADGYETLLMVGRYPVGVFIITVDPSQVDVNVHPSKDIVKFEQESLILSAVQKSVSDSLSQQHLLRDHETPDIQEKIPLSQDRIFQNSSTTPARTYVTDQPQFTAQVTQQIRSSPIESQAPQTFQQYQPQPQQYTIKESNQSVLEQTTEHIPVDEFLELRYIGLIHRTYAICESKEGLVMIDFHAAHERYLYEILKANLTGSEIKNQRLLTPIVIELSPAQTLIVNEHKSLLSELGFDCEEFGENTIMLRSVPILFHKQMNKAIMLDILEELFTGQSTALDIVKDKIMIRMSCRAADKAGDELSDEKIKQIIRDVAKARHRYSCPHGRPIFLNISHAELEKMFKRRV